MAIIDIFSKRQKKLRGEVPEVYQFVNIPTSLRVQIVHIVKDTIGISKEVFGHKNQPKENYEFIHKSLCREYGVFTLSKSEYRETAEDCVINFLLQTSETEKVIDVIEILFKLIDRIIKVDKHYIHHNHVEMTPESAIDELNQRFKENSVGYQFDGGEIIRVDTTYTHNEIVKPVLTLLWNKKFKGANEEYLKAHEHYRHGRNKECLAECLKAFESVMKIICKEKGWQYNTTDTSRKLINICFQNQLIPTYTQNQFSSLQNLLESGIPTIRNKLGGHGQGQELQKVDNEMTRYGLNLTGTNILFLVEQSGLK